SRSRISRSERPIFSSSSTIRIRFINRQQHAKRGPAQFPFHCQDVSAQQERAFSGDREPEAHAPLLERDGRLEQASTRLFAHARRRRSRLSTSSTTICAACSKNAESFSPCRDSISSTVRRIGVSEFFTSCAIFRASVCQLASCVR